MTIYADDQRLEEAIAAGPEAPAEPDLARLFGELREETRLLVSHEVELAKAEFDEAKSHLVKGVAGSVAAAVLGMLAVVLLSVAAAWGLAEFLPTWAAFLIVGGAWVLLTAIAATVARTAFRKFDPVPRRTIQTLKEDARWARTLTS